MSESSQSTGIVAGPPVGGLRLGAARAIWALHVGVIAFLLAGWALPWSSAWWVYAIGAPFIQIGETKYGRPILVRVFDPSMSFDEAAKLLLVSYDSTAKANLSVGPPLDLQLYATDSLEATPSIRIEADDPLLRSISTGWGDALNIAFKTLPDVNLF